MKSSGKCRKTTFRFLFYLSVSRPDMKMLEIPEYALFEIHEFGERRLGLDEKPLLGELSETALSPQF